MGKLKDLAQVRFSNAFVDIVNNCNLKKEGKVQEEAELKALESETSYYIECEGIEIDIAFDEMLKAHNVFKIAKELGL